MIYLDFEGFANKKPSFVGYQIDGEFSQLILDKEFSLISDETDIAFMDIEEFCHLIIDRSNKLKKPIVAWSTNELSVFSKYHKSINYFNLLQGLKKQSKRIRP